LNQGDGLVARFRKSVISDKRVDTVMVWDWTGWQKPKNIKPVSRLRGDNNRVGIFIFIRFKRIKLNRFFAD
jgi:hypothetical protein